MIFTVGKGCWERWECETTRELKSEEPPFITPLDRIERPDIAGRLWNRPLPPNSTIQRKEPSSSKRSTRPDRFRLALKLMEHARRPQQSLKISNSTRARMTRKDGHRTPVPNLRSSTFTMAREPRPPPLSTVDIAARHARHMPIPPRQVHFE